MGWFSKRNKRADKAKRATDEMAEIVQLLDSLGKCVAAQQGTAPVPSEPKPDGAGERDKASWVEQTLAEVRARDSIIPKEEMLGPLRKMAKDYLDKGWDWDDTIFFMTSFVKVIPTQLLVKWLFEIKREETVN